jgi:hypothetical protein
VGGRETADPSRSFGMTTKERREGWECRAYRQASFGVGVAGNARSPPRRVATPLKSGRAVNEKKLIAERSAEKPARQRCGTLLKQACQMPAYQA